MLFIVLPRYRKTKVSKKAIATKISNIEKRRYNLSSFQRTEESRILNILSICNYSDHLFSISYGKYSSFVSGLTFSRIFSEVMMHL